MGYMMVAAFAGACVVVAWLLIGAFYALIFGLAKPSGRLRIFLTTVFALGAFVPVFVAHAWYEGIAEEISQHEQERAYDPEEFGPLESSIPPRSLAAPARRSPR